MEWQPIETAPKDETRILVCSAGDGQDHAIVYWFSDDERSGWFNGDYIYDADDFTHWMPLPKPPAA